MKKEPTIIEETKNVIKYDYGDGLIKYRYKLTLKCNDIIESWWLGGDRHCETGPAIIWSDGKVSWYYRGEWVKCQSQQEFEQFLRLKAFW